MFYRNLGLCFAAAACCAIGAPASALTAKAIWDGTIQITAQSSQCDAAGFQLTGNIPGYLRPKLRNLDPVAALMFGNGDKQGQLVDDGGNPTLEGAGNYKGVFMSGQMPTRSWTGSYNFMMADPVTSASRYIKVNGTISNFIGIAGCDITVRAGFVKRLPGNT